MVGSLLLAGLYLMVLPAILARPTTPILLAVWHAAAPGVVWGVAAGPRAGLAAGLVTGWASILLGQAIKLAEAFAQTPLAAVVLAAGWLLGVPVLGAFAGGAIGAHRASRSVDSRGGRRRGFMVGFLGAVAGFAPWEWVGSGDLLRRLAGSLTDVLPFLLIVGIVVGLAGAAGSWLGSPAGPFAPRVRWLLVGLVVNSPAGYLLGLVLLGGVGLGPGVTREGIRAVQLGMTRDQVEALLGPPVSSGPGLSSDGGVTLSYARPVPFARSYPMLWVQLREGRVISVYAKQYIRFGMDDHGIYILDGERRSEGGYLEAAFPR